MLTIDSSLVIMLSILGICASAGAGIYLRGRFGSNAVMHSFKKPSYIGLGITILSLALTTSFALAGLYAPLIATTFVSSGVLAALIWNTDDAHLS